MKLNVEGFIEKIEIIVSGIKNNQKTNKSVASKLVKFDENLLTFVKREELNTTMVEFERRCNEKVSLMGSQCNERTSELSEELIKTR